MASTIRAKLILGLLPGLVVLLIIVGASFATLRQIDNTVTQLYSYIEADIATDGATPPHEAAIHDQLTNGIAEIRSIHVRAERNLLVILVLAVAGGVLFARTFSTHLVQPVKVIAAQAGRLASGLAVEPTGIYRNDELGDLSRAFDAMAASVDASSTALRQLLADRSKELNALNQVSALISKSTDLDEALQQALETVLEVVNATQGGIWVTTKDGGMRLAASVDQPRAIVTQEQRMQLGACLCGQAAELGRTLLVHDMQTMPHMAQSLCCQHGVRSLLAVPVQVQERVVGMIRVAHETACSLSMQDELFLAAAGRQIGIAIEKERINAAERRQRELADTLRSVSQTLVSSLELGTVLDTILEQVGHVLQVDAGLILLAQGDELEVAAVRGRPELNMERWRHYRFPAQNSAPLSQVLAEKQPLTFCDPYRVDLFEQGIDHIEDVQWCLVVPLLVDHRTIGLLALEQIGHCYDQDEEAKIAFAFANQAAVAIENARLYSQVQELNRDLEARVERRTRQLADARDALARQAEQLRRLLNATIEIQENERSRIARDVHDGVIQWVLSALFELEATRISLSKGPERVGERLTTVQTMLQQVKDELYQVIYDLHPPLLASNGLAAAIRAHAHEFEMAWNVAVPLQIEGSPRRLASKEELALYRIAQEAMGNALDHGQASRVQVHLCFETDRVLLSVSDNGCGFDPSAGDGRGAPHLGLISMQERATAIGAHLEIDSAPGRGTTIRVELHSRAPSSSPPEENAYVFADTYPAG